MKRCVSNEMKYARCTISNKLGTCLKNSYNLMRNCWKVFTNSIFACESCYFPMDFLIREARLIFTSEQRSAMESTSDFVVFLYVAKMVFFCLFFKHFLNELAFRFYLVAEVLMEVIWWLPKQDEN